MIEHQVAVPLLVGPALTRLQPNPLLDSGSYPGDLLAAVLAVNAEYWKPRPDPEVAAWKLADGLYDRSPGATFTQVDQNVHLRASTSACQRLS